MSSSSRLRARLIASVAMTVAVGGCTPPDAEIALPKVDCPVVNDPAPAKERGFVGKIQDGFGPVDEKFGAWLVGPLAKILFFDLMFWDNALTDDDKAAALGKTIRGREFMGFDETKQEFQTKRRYRAWASKTALVSGASSSATNVGPKGVDDGAGQNDVPPTLQTEFGTITLSLVDDNGEKHGRVNPTTVDVSGYALGEFTRWAGPPFTPAPSEKPENLKVVQGLAPFPLLAVVDGTSARILATDVPLSAMRAAPGAPSNPAVRPAPASGPTTKTVGAIVRVGDEQCTIVDTAEIIEVLDDGRVALRSTTIEPFSGNPSNRSLPFIVVWLVIGALFFTGRMAFINIRGFRHAFDVVRGKFDRHDDPGEISHFQALSSALSATVGLGNIAGVAIAVSTGGPGAVFWMVVAGFLGMSSKFVECTLGVMYREVNERGVVLGGPMRYLQVGLAERGQKGLGRVLSIMFMVMCIGGSFGGGNMFQANQAFAAVVERFPGMVDYGWVFGLVLAAFVGLVIIGGIRRIGAAASLLVPLMCGTYLLAGTFILIANFEHLGWALGIIISEAFTPQAGLGGLVGVLITGFQRAAFSNEAGVGSASIAHAAASTDEPVREGIVALLEPFIDTIVVCTMTGVIVVVTGVYTLPRLDGVVMTSYAFQQTIPWFPWVLTVTVILFAFSTQISWSYYGERCWTMLFGARTSMIYRVLFLFFVFFGAVFKLGNVLDFSDLMVLGMAFPNILGALLLSSKVRKALDEYWQKLKSGEMKPQK